jgi:peroxiredoxin
MQLTKITVLTFTLFSFLLSKDLPLGSSIPLSSIKMESINGEKVSLNDVMMENGLLVNFTCNTCPWVKRWQDRYNGLAEASKKNKLGCIAINPNAGKRDRGESMDDMKKFSDKYDHNFLYALDKEAKLATAFGARTTPHIYLFNGEGKLVYKGAIDDNAAKKRKVKKNYLMNAIKAVGKNKEVKLAETKALGCSIKFP